MYKAITILALLLVGCNSESNQQHEHAPERPTQKQEREQAVTLRHDFTSISPLYSEPYTTPYVEYNNDVVTINITELRRGESSCVGECELPITGYTLTGQGSTLFSIGTDTILTDIMITSGARSSICYETDTGWFVAQYFYRGTVTYKESQGGCYSYLTDTVIENWMYSVVVSANADIRGSSVFTIGEVK